MTKTNGAGSAQQTILEKITAAVAAFSLDQCVFSGGPIEDGEVVLAHANDYLKKIYGYREAEQQAATKLTSRFNDISMAMAETLPRGTASTMTDPNTIAVLAKVDWSAMAEQAAEANKIMTEVQSATRYCELLNKLFWAEVLNFVRASKGGGVGIRDGWAIVQIPEVQGEQESSDNIEALLGKLAGSKAGFRRSMFQ